MKKKENMEKLRSKLNTTANLNNLSEQEIIDLSQELDKEIIKFYKEQEEPHKTHVSISFAGGGTDGL